MSGHVTNDSTVRMFMEVVQIKDYEMAKKVMDHFNQDIDKSVDFILEEVNPEVDKQTHTMRQVITDKLSILSGVDMHQEQIDVQGSNVGWGFFGAVIYGAYDLAFNKAVFPIVGILFRPIWYLINVFMGVKKTSLSVDRFFIKLKEKLSNERFRSLNLVQVKFSEIGRLRRVKFPLLFFFIAENDDASFEHVVNTLKNERFAGYLSKIFICGEIISNPNELNEMGSSTRNKTMPFALFLRRRSMKRPLHFELKLEYQHEYMLTTIMQPILMDFLENTTNGNGNNRGGLSSNFNAPRLHELFSERRFEPKPSQHPLGEPGNVSQIVREQNAAYEETLKKDMERLATNSKTDDPLSERKHLIVNLLKQKRVNCSKVNKTNNKKSTMLLRVSIPDDKKAFTYECSPEDRVNELVDYILLNNDHIEKDFFISTIMPAKRLYKFSKDHDKSATFKDFGVASTQKLTLSYISDSEECSD